ncbi:MAG: hypothetical protein ACO20H_01705 [Bacteriovoracaceae bacterium]
MIFFKWAVLILIFALAFISICIFVLYRVQKKREEKEDQYLPDYIEDLPPPQSYQIIGRSPLDPLDGPDWPNMMAMISKRLIKHKVTKVVLINGTFMGEDPFDLFQALPYLPKSIKSFIIKVSTFIRELIFTDGAQFSHKYLQMLQSSLGEVDVHSFTWSSSNHHIGRLRGALKLLELLSSFQDKRILLMAHSHGGQCLALLTQILDKKWECDPLQRQVVNLKKLDLLTLGMPARYRFKLNENIKLLHLINHRTALPLGGHFTGVPFTRDGDYLQQWGVEGSDNPSPSLKDNRLNKELNIVLGAGTDPLQWKKNIKKRSRVPKDGHTYLIDYGDRGFFINTLLGHAIYTRKSMMLKTFRILVDFFY